MSKKSKHPNFIMSMEVKFGVLLDHFKNIALNIFEWKNLPKGLTSEYIEKKLFEVGSLFFFNDESLGNLCLPFNNASNLNVYEYPDKVRVTGHNYYKEVNFQDGVVIRNNPLKIATIVQVKMWLEHIIDVLGAFKVNLNHSKTPYLISGNKEQMLTLKNLVEQITGNELAIFVDDKLSDLSTIDLKQTGVSYIGDKLLDAYDRLEDKLLTFLGINNANTSKRERLVVDEVNSNNDEIENNLDTFFTARKKAVEEINKKFGTSISVDINQMYVSRMKEKVSRETIEETNEETERNGDE